MIGTTKRTTDHATIRRWAEERGASPAAVKGYGPGREASGLRLDFPDVHGIWLEEITWDEFFRRFEDQALEFFYQDVDREGERSNFFRLINRGNGQQRAA
ncbi:MAG: hypothetical protein R2826_01675 [Thermoleophilia bacterium]